MIVAEKPQMEKIIDQRIVKKTRRRPILNIWSSGRDTQ
jgi:hypothetical protein